MVRDCGEENDNCRIIRLSLPGPLEWPVQLPALAVLTDQSLPMEALPVVVASCHVTQAGSCTAHSTTSVWLLKQQGT